MDKRVFIFPVTLCIWIVGVFVILWKTAAAFASRDQKRIEDWKTWMSH